MVQVIAIEGAGSMFRTVITYGVIAGLVVITINTLSMELGHGHVWLGFLVMFIAFSTIFVAVNQYREQTLGGVISFGTALLIGLGISGTASVVYVVVWEAYLALTDYGFVEAYVNSMMEAKRAAGASTAELAEALADAERVRAQYADPLFRVPVTFLEIFPVGLLISFITAGIQRSRG
jgi:Protein of unknown function (DUF4199)